MKTMIAFIFHPVNKVRAELQKKSLEDKVGSSMG
jgi:hypothetical protein